MKIFRHLSHFLYERKEFISKIIQYSQRLLLSNNWEKNNKSHQFRYISDCEMVFPLSEKLKKGKIILFRF